MKRTISLILIIIIAISLATFISACTQTGDCDFCFKKDVPVYRGDMLGETVYACKECKEDIESLRR